MGSGPYVVQLDNRGLKQKNKKMGCHSMMIIMYKYIGFVLSLNTRLKIVSVIKRWYHESSQISLEQNLCVLTIEW